MKIAVVTALAGINNFTDLTEKDNHLENSLYDVKYDSADYYFFSDKENLSIPDGWIKRELFPYYLDSQFRNRRACRFVKQLTHYLLPDYDYYIWHDFTHKVNENPIEIVNKLADEDIAFFEHPEQRGWRGEMLAASHREHPALVEFTINYLTSLKIPESLTLWETSAFVRKNNPKANECFTLWNDLLTKLTSRDQVTLPAALYITKPKVLTLPGRAQVKDGNNLLIPQKSTSLHVQGFC